MTDQLWIITHLIRHLEATRFTDSLNNSWHMQELEYYQETFSKKSIAQLKAIAKEWKVTIPD